MPLKTRGGYQVVYFSGSSQHFERTLGGMVNFSVNKRSFRISDIRHDLLASPFALHWTQPTTTRLNCDTASNVPSRIPHVINSEGTYWCGFPASRKQENPRSAQRCDRSFPRLEGACAEVHAAVRHPPWPPELCDGSVSVKSTFVMSS